nr:biotin transporter BioY [Promineifilum sp.]
MQAISPRPQTNRSLSRGIGLFLMPPMIGLTLVVLLLGAAYGWRLGGATVLLYLAEGALGLPVFAGAGAGPAYMT